MKKVLLSALALLAIAGSGFTQNLPSYLPANGLVGWWPFNGNANDESGNGNNGSVNGPSPATDRLGNADKAYAFNGGSTISVPHNNSLNPSANYCISIWYKVTVDNFPASDMLIKGPNDFQGRPFYFRQHATNFNSPTTAWSFGSTDPHPYVLAEILPLDQWHHTVINIVDSVGFLYLDNVKKDSVSITQIGNFSQNASPLRFGGGYYQFWGSLDDIAIWNRSLSREEITNLFSAENNPVNCANDLSLTPTSLQLNSGSTASFSATTSDPNPAYRWQSDLGLGFQDLSNFGQYSGAGSNSLQVANLQLRNHQQKFRVISTSGNCVDTSALATISLSDTCINVVNDTNLVTVTDTLIISITANPGLVQNTLKAYPNPTAGMLFINTGNFAAMPGYSIRIASVTGQEVYNAVVNQPLLQVPLESLSPEGLFYLRLYDASGTLVTTRKIVLQ
jgi:hypothetical protein